MFLSQGNKIFAVGLCFIGLQFVVACSSDSKSEDLSYSFVSNGCATGKQEFASKEGYCKGLLDNQLNKGCALEMRVSAHKEQCQ